MAALLDPTRVRVVVVTDLAAMGCRDAGEVAARVVAAAGPHDDGRVAVQLRARELDGGALLAAARAIQAALPRLPLMINDRVDVALAAGGSGAHLPERGLRLEDARRVLPAPSALGASRHAPAAAVAALDAGATLVHLGPVWATPSKAGLGAPLGASALAAARAALGERSVLVAVGGIDGPGRAEEATRAGADAIAAIRAVWAAPAPAEAIGALVEAAARGRGARGAHRAPPDPPAPRGPRGPRA